MFHNNKELRISLILLSVATTMLTLIAVTISITAGALVLLLGLIAITVHLATEYYRYRKLQKLSSDLDKLLISGTPLPIREYSEGELSILANQIQKMTLRLTESAEAIKADKVYLADSLADISHQLRTPLTAMNLTTTMLRNPEMPIEKRMELTGELRSLLTRTEWLVETLLKLSKLDAGTVKLAQDPVRVKNLVARAAKPIAIPMDLRNQTLIINCAEETFTGDLVWTAEAIGNILKNCMEHTPEGGKIEIETTDNALYTEILIKDNGTGISKEDMPHIFERFYKGKDSDNKSFGVGLALARMIITSQKGTVKAENRKPSGAMFSIRFYKGTV